MTIKKLDASQIFMHAHAYFQAQELIYEQCKDSTEVLTFFVFPCTTLGAFACELFLKCLVTIETGNTPTGHDLRRLYDQLSATTRARLEELWSGYAEHRKEQWDTVEKERGEKVARDLPSAISAGSRAFELVRYRYENSDEKFSFYLDDLPHMLGRVALELKPEWMPPNEIP